MKRRTFIEISIAAAAGSAALSSCKNKKIKGAIVGASSKVGHLLRGTKMPGPVMSSSKKKIVIIGAGVSGLSAGYFLKKRGETDFIILDLEKEAGGNSRSGGNKFSDFPWGAHYIPIPNNDLTAYLEFLQASDVIIGYENELPVYNESFLCFDPQERLYINGKWQDGLVPNFGVPEEDKNQISAFLKKMNEFRYQKGKDKKDAFAIPVNNSSYDTELIALDTITMEQWLNTNNFTSHYLHSYVNYCTRDDYGTEHSEISAWMGIHYFACRKGKGFNAEYQDVLTWPQGNNFLIQNLKKTVTENLLQNSLALKIRQNTGHISVEYFDVKSGTVKGFEAEQCILAIPQFIAARLLEDPARNNFVKESLEYTPWAVANITVSELKEKSGVGLSWDNVIFNSDSLGYVDSTHELIQQILPKRNLTYYLPLTKQPASVARQNALTATYEEWLKIVITDLENVHPGIKNAIEEFNVMIWGHSMAKPKPGHIFGEQRKRMAATIDNRIHFAHTDNAGASFFEEAFYQGLNAADKINDLAHE